MKTLSYSSSGLDSFVQLLSVLVIFVVVLLATYLVTRWVGNFQKSKNINSNLEVIETYRLANNKYLQIVRAGNVYLVIAVSKDTITMLTTLEKEQLDLLKGNENNLTSINFQDVLEKVKSWKK